MSHFASQRARVSSMGSQAAWSHYLILSSFDFTIFSLFDSLRLVPKTIVLIDFIFLFSEEDKENGKDKKVWYYSSKVQLAELIDSLDKEYWEYDLCRILEEMRDEIHRHMDVTEDLTNKVRGNNKSCLSAANGKWNCLWRLMMYAFHFQIWKKR